MFSLLYGGHLVCSSRPVSLLVQVPHGVCGRSVGMWCDAALSRNYTEDLLISLAVCWKRAIAQGGLYFMSVSIPVGLL